VKEKPQKVRRQLEQRGALDALRSDLARGSAMQLLIDGAEVVDGEGNPIDLSLPDEDVTNEEPATATPEAPEAAAAEEEPEAWPSDPELHRADEPRRACTRSVHEAVQ
jgi:hypothetical protein